MYCLNKENRFGISKAVFYIITVQNIKILVISICLFKISDVFQWKIVTKILFCDILFLK